MPSVGVKASPVSLLRWLSDEPRTRRQGWCVGAEGGEVVGNPFIEECAEGQGGRTEARTYDDCSSWRYEASSSPEAGIGTQGRIGEGRCEGSEAHVLGGQEGGRSEADPSCCRVGAQGRPPGWYPSCSR